MRNAGSRDQETLAHLDYIWNGWDEPNFHERKKKGFDILRNAYEDKTLAGREEETR